MKKQEEIIDDSYSVNVQENFRTSFHDQNTELIDLELSIKQSNDEDIEKRAISAEKNEESQENIDMQKQKQVNHIFTQHLPKPKSIIFMEKDRREGKSRIVGQDSIQILREQNEALKAQLENYDQAISNHLQEIKALRQKQTKLTNQYCQQCKGFKEQLQCIIEQAKLNDDLRKQKEENKNSLAKLQQLDELTQSLTKQKQQKQKLNIKINQIQSRLEQSNNMVNCQAQQLNNISEAHQKIKDEFKNILSLLAQKDNRLSQLESKISQSKEVIEEKIGEVLLTKNKLIQIESLLEKQKEDNKEKQKQISIINKKMSQLIENNHKLIYERLTIFSTQLNLQEKILNQERQSTNALLQKFQDISKEKTDMTLQLLQQRQINLLQIQQINGLQIELSLKKYQIQLLNKRLKIKDQELNLIDSEYVKYVQKQAKAAQQALSNNIEYFTQAIQQNNRNHKQSILAKEDNWNNDKIILWGQIQILQLLLKEHQEHEKLAEDRFKLKIEAFNSQYKQLQRIHENEHMQSETQRMNIQEQLEKRVIIIQSLERQKSVLIASTEFLKGAISSASIHREFDELISKLSKQNGNKQLDGVIQSFLTIKITLINKTMKNQENQFRISQLNRQNTAIKDANINKQRLIQDLYKKINNIDREKQQIQAQLKKQSSKIISKTAQIQELTILFDQQQIKNNNLKAKINQLNENNQNLNLLLHEAKRQHTSLNKQNQSNQNAQIFKLNTTIQQLNSNINQLNNIIQLMTKQERKLKQSNIYQNQQSLKQSKQIADLKKQIVYLTALKAPKINQQEIHNYKRQIAQLKEKIQDLLTSGPLCDKSQITSSYEQLYQNAKQAKQLLEQQLDQWKQKFNKLKHKNQNIMPPPQNRVNLIENADPTITFFTMSSMITDDAKGKQFIISTLEDFCKSKTEKIQMIFKMDDNNKTAFHSTFKLPDMTEGINIFLFQKKSSIFGFMTFHQKIKGVPSSIMFSVNNRKCVVKDEQKYESNAFKYEFNTLYFGNSEVKFKSGFKNLSVSDAAIRKYFGKYVKSQIFGEQFKEVLQVQSFEIHKVII